MRGYVDAVVGMQRGDEGKGRIVDMIAPDYGVVTRFNGGDNAGHTVVLPGGDMFKLNLIPCGITRPDVDNVLGNGVFLNPVSLTEEMDGLSDRGIDVFPGNFKISKAAHLIFPYHIGADEIREKGAGRQGSTLSGIAPVASDKALRQGCQAEMINRDPSKIYDMVIAGLVAQIDERARVGLEPLDIGAVTNRYMESAVRLGAYIVDTSIFLNDALKAGKNVLAEGAQAFLLDIDHGMVPYTTSSSTTSGGISPGLGIAPHYVNRVIGITKAVQSHVGDGPFVTEETDEVLLKQLHGDTTAPDAEFGTKTGRTRRLGSLDLPQIRRAFEVNAPPDKSEMVLTKLDWVPRSGERTSVCVSYDVNGGEEKVAPASAAELEQSRPNYEQLPTWEGDISGVRRFQDLPPNAQKYVEFVEEQVGVPITMVGVGQRRDQIIVRS